MYSYLGKNPFPPFLINGKGVLQASFYIHYNIGCLASYPLRIHAPPPSPDLLIVSLMARTNLSICFHLIVFQIELPCLHFVVVVKRILNIGEKRIYSLKLQLGPSPSNNCNNGWLIVCKIIESIAR